VSSLSIEVFDPAFVDVGNRCELMPRRSATDPAWPGPERPNPFVSDAGSRYAFGSPTTRPPSGGEFCTGDAMFAEAGVPAGVPLAPVVTTYAVHAPSVGGDPWRSPVLPGCVRQFGGWSGGAATLGRALASTSPADRPLQRVFRQWVTVCTIGAPSVGDYYLQVRTNLPLGAATAARVADPREDPSATGSGINRLAVRVNAPGDQSAVSVAGLERLQAYVNLSGVSASFLLARVGSVAAGSTLRVELFDIGDAAEPATLRLVRPPDATGTWSGRCRAVGDVRGSPAVPVELPGCALPGASAGAGFNGMVQRFDVDIPPDYACADGDPASCWFRVAVDYRSAVSDTTTWGATLEGDPVRLVR